MIKHIYCLGDSNTYGYDPRSPLGGRYDKSWPDLLAQQTGCTVFSDGVNGRRIQDVLFSYDLLKDRLRKQQPDLLILMLGSNDILMDDCTDPEALSLRLSHLLSCVREDFKDLPVFLLSPLQIRLPGPCSAASITFSRQCFALAEQYHLGFLSLPELALPLAYDGVHLTEDGHRQLSGILSRQLFENLQK